MPIHRTFVYQEDDDTGIKGLKPTWIRNANAFRGVAHDILEHFPLNERLNVVEDEFQALGAVLALRISSGQFSSFMSASGHVSSLVYSVLSDMYRYSLDRPRAQKTRPLQDEHDWAEQAIIKGVSQAWELTRSELQDEFDFADDYETLDVEKDISLLTDNIISHLRIGYRRAYRRYAQADIYTVGSYLFKELDTLSGKICDSPYLNEGDVVSFSVDPRQCRITARINGTSLENYGL